MFVDFFEITSERNRSEIEAQRRGIAQSAEWGGSRIVRRVWWVV